jgi:hypothetical protein
VANLRAIGSHGFLRVAVEAPSIKVADLLNRAAVEKFNRSYCSCSVRRGVVQMARDRNW